MQYDPNSGTAPKPIEPTGFFTGIRFRPIVTGAIIDFMATMLLVEFYFRFYVAPKGISGDSYEAEAVKFWLSTDGLVASLLLGSLGTLIGGFYAAYKAGTLEMKHGALVGVLSIIIGLLMTSGNAEHPTPEWFTALAFAAAIPAGALGGFFAEMVKGLGGNKSSPGSISTRV